ncbi:substrate-binding domain-containing protein [Advenella kashmirensis]
MSEQIVVYAAGSLKRAFTAVLTRFAQLGHPPVLAEFGPAGWLRQRLEQGEHADLFASADSASPARLVALGSAFDPQIFARNTLCAVVQRDSDITDTTLLAAMLDPGKRLGMSTPVLDPSGDYALQVFSNADNIHPGAGQTLRAKAIALVGGKIATPIPHGWVASEYLVSTGAADIFLSYASYRNAILAAGRTRVIALPDSLQVLADYAMVSMQPQNERVQQLRAFILGEEGQMILASHGFLNQNHPCHPVS